MVNQVANDSIPAEKGTASRCSLARRRRRGGREGKSDERNPGRGVGRGAAEQQAGDRLASCPAHVSDTPDRSPLGLGLR